MSVTPDMSNIEQPDDAGRSICLAPIFVGLVRRRVLSAVVASAFSNTALAYTLREMLRAVPAYSFSIRNSDGSDGEFLGLSDLPNDYGALAFGSDVIRDMLRDNVDRHAGWLMDIMDGERYVCSIVFPFLAQDRMRA